MNQLKKEDSTGGCQQQPSSTNIVRELDSLPKFDASCHLPVASTPDTRLIVVLIVVLT